MREIRTLGSAEGAQGDPRPYSNIAMTDPGVHDGAIWAFTMAGIRSRKRRQTRLWDGAARGVSRDEEESESGDEDEQTDAHRSLREQ